MLTCDKMVFCYKGSVKCILDGISGTVLVLHMDRLCNSLSHATVWNVFSEYIFISPKDSQNIYKKI